MERMVRNGIKWRETETTETERDRQKWTETDKKGQKQTETDRKGQNMTKTDESKRPKKKKKKIKKKRRRKNASLLGKTLEQARLGSQLFAILSPDQPP